MSAHILRIATRGSALALWQAEHTRRCLQERDPGLQVELVVLKTQGDKILDRPLFAVGGKGLFTKEIEEALLDGRADVAVHSLKDLPGDSDLHDALHVAAIPLREDPADALVLPTFLATDHAGQSAREILCRLGTEARIGTSSLRRACQIRSINPALQIGSLRGNVDTRLRKVDIARDAWAQAGSERLDAVVLAAAGLRRLGRADRITVRFTSDELVPACGQGALALQCRKDDAQTTARLAQLADHASTLAVTAERAFNTHLGGSCHTPLGALSRVRDGDDLLHIQGFVGSVDGLHMLRGERQAQASTPEAARDLGRHLADDLLSQGAKALLHSVQ
ncbi:MAG: hydroxymethylbilane synthase [Myxococcales bacterium]|nr:hydroxymethylbilane synthase [Myxococcales bacterium]